MNEAIKIIETAESHIGTKESPPNSNNVVFNTHYYGHPVSGADYPWCCVFVWDVFREAGLSHLFVDGTRTAYCPIVESWGIHNQIMVDKNNGRQGDIALMDFGKGRASHIGFITFRNSDGTYNTIEGNTSVKSNDNGGCVMRRTRPQSCIRYIIRPEYNLKTREGKMNISKGAKGEVVKRLQKMLVENGFSVGATGCDGDFGDNTKRAVLTYQHAMALSMDGIAGPETLSSLEMTVDPQINVEKFCSYVARTYRMAHDGCYTYADSMGMPPCIDGKISCDRLISRALYDMDFHFHNQRKGGEVCGTLPTYLPAMGFKEIKDPSKITRGDIVQFADNGNPAMWHVFFILKKNGDHVVKYDMGSQKRIESKQPFVTSFNEWNGNKWFLRGWRLQRNMFGGSQVKALQEFINKLLFVELAIDGSFGAKTTEAYKKMTKYFEDNYKVKLH